MTAANNNGLIDQFRPVTLFNRGIKGIAIKMTNRKLRQFRVGDGALAGTDRAGHIGPATAFGERSVKMLSPFVMAIRAQRVQHAYVYCFCSRFAKR